MELPVYYLTQPPADWGAETRAAFNVLFTQAVESGDGAAIEYQLDAPKWQFLNYLCERRRIVLHGSGEAHITEFEPRKADDVSAFGDRRAIYAASDGIWAMYFAIVDRANGVRSLVNAAFHVLEEGNRSGPYYFFSINGDALPNRPWRQGTIYLLSADTFEQQPNLVADGAEIESSQWASLVPVRPLAKLAVTPEDFPFLAQIVPHDPEEVRRRALANPGGFPWLDD